MGSRASDTLFSSSIGHTTIGHVAQNFCPRWLTCTTFELTPDSPPEWVSWGSFPATMACCVLVRNAYKSISSEPYCTEEIALIGNGPSECEYELLCLHPWIPRAMHDLVSPQIHSPAIAHVGIAALGCPAGRSPAEGRAMNICFCHSGRAHANGIRRIPPSRAAGYRPASVCRAVRPTASGYAPSAASVSCGVHEFRASNR